MAKQINFSMTATFCIFTQGKTNQNFFMTTTFCIFTHGKTNQILNDSNILHFFYKTKIKTNFKIISNILFTCKLTQFKQ